MKVYIVVEDQVYDYGAYDHKIIVHGIFTNHSEAVRVQDEKAKYAYSGPKSVYIETHILK